MGDWTDGRPTSVLLEYGVGTQATFDRIADNEGALEAVDRLARRGRFPDEEKEFLHAARHIKNVRLVAVAPSVGAPGARLGLAEYCRRLDEAIVREALLRLRKGHRVVVVAGLSHGVGGSTKTKGVFEQLSKYAPDAVMVLVGVPAWELRLERCGRPAASWYELDGRHLYFSPQGSNWTRLRREQIGLGPLTPRWIRDLAPYAEDLSRRIRTGTEEQKRGAIAALAWRDLWRIGWSSRLVMEAARRDGWTESTLSLLRTCSIYDKAMIEELLVGMNDSALPMVTRFELALALASNFAALPDVLSFLSTSPVDVLDREMCEELLYVLGNTGTAPKPRVDEIRARFPALTDLASEAMKQSAMLAKKSGATPNPSDGIDD